MYVAAGPRGFLALNQETGEFINFLSPIYDNDNYVDVAIGPDARLYFANATERGNQRIMVTDRVGGFANSWGVEGDAPANLPPECRVPISVSKKVTYGSFPKGTPFRLFSASIVSFTRQPAANDRPRHDCAGTERPTLLPMRSMKTVYLWWAKRVAYEC